MSALLERRRVELDDLPGLFDSPVEDGRSHSGPDHQRVLGPDRRRAVDVSLYHTHIPKLEAAGLLSFDRDTGVVELELHPDIYGGPVTEHLLGSVDQAVWSAAAAVHRDRRRGAVLSLLSESGPTLSVGDLASRLADSSVRGVSHFGEGVGETKEDVEVTLHHVHLPVLARVGLLTYDVPTGGVTYTGDNWFDLSDFVETLPSHSRYGL